MVDAKFWRHVYTREPEACWLWTGATRNGYGAVKRDGRLVYAHRFALEQKLGPLPADRVVRHSCDVRLCCNPGHLTLGTKLDNSRDMKDRDRQSRGDRRSNAKLSESMVADARRRRLRPRELAAASGVSLRTARKALAGSTWRCVAP